ncbi:MAG: prolipoprotein diacylglyceryl transferase [Rhodothalassiaceae bacterium]
MLAFAMAGVLAYPEIDPVMFRIFGLPIRWYSMAYLLGLLFAWWWARRIAERRKLPVTRADLDDFLTYAILSVILGGRLGYVLFYKPLYYLENPLAILRLWDGGMSFHGGLVATTLLIIFFARSRKIPLYRFADLIAAVVPVGLMLGRLANFINGELWGRPTDLAIAMIFPADPLGLPRHPSQLYEAFLEGALLFTVLNFLVWRTDIMKKRPGFIVGCFFLGYGLARFIVEYAREPDAHLGLLAGLISMGQILSLPMILFGLWLVHHSRRTAERQPAVRR